MEKVIINACDGYPLTAMIGTPVDNVRGVIVISSATCIKKEFYIHFAQFLVKHGYYTLIYDYRGIGESAPADLKKAPIFIHEWGTKDMNAILNYLVEQRGFTDITWVGHSIGAQLVGLLRNNQHIRKVVSINAAVGYWGYFPFPMKLVVWLLWYVIGPLLIYIYGYGVMKKIGWGENLPRTTILEWRQWCMSKTYYMDFLKSKLKTDRFYEFTTPITAVYTSDDYIANDKTARLMMQFFPNAPSELIKLEVGRYTQEKVGHIGIFRKRFQCKLWPVLLQLIQNPAVE
jgi:predicted alpha/beta hydrolase